jgi:[ribosomal protein S18]-alanine N-acetyltransferase
LMAITSTLMFLPMNFSFRAGEMRDIEAMYALDQICFQRIFAFTKATFRYLAANCDNISIVAESRAGSLAGFAILEIHPPDSTCLTTIDIHPDFRRKGLGSHLLQHALKIASGRGLFKTHLQVYVGNEAAIAFYLGFGYCIEEYLPDFYARGVDACLMSFEVHFPAESIHEIRDYQ